MTVYYIVAVTITLAGMICFFGIAKHPKGKLLFAKKDAELRKGSNPTTPSAVNSVRLLLAFGCLLASNATKPVTTLATHFTHCPLCSPRWR